MGCFTCLCNFHFLHSSNWYHLSHYKSSIFTIHFNCFHLSLSKCNFLKVRVFSAQQQPGLNIITEYVIGYMYPERPVANMCFKVYGYISMSQALTFLADFKLGHYMKIPPRAMFMAQVGLCFPSLICTS